MRSVWHVLFGLVLGFAGNACSKDDSGSEPSEGGAGGRGGITGGHWSASSGAPSSGGSAASGGTAGDLGGNPPTSGGNPPGSGGDSPELGGAPTGGQGGSTGGTSESLPALGNCTIFTADDLWNTDIFDAPVDEAWTEVVQDLAGGVNLHPDFGGNGEYGIHVNVVPESQPMVPVSIDWYPEESDPGPYPFPGPDDVRIEGNNPRSCDGDCHLLVLQEGSCMLYEGGGCEYTDGWHCGAGAIWDLGRNSYGQRPMGWTSVDAAGLPVTAGILRYDEVIAGAVRHAIRFTLSCTTDQYVRPATHFAVPGDCDPDGAPPMGLRVRLNRSFDTSGFGPHVRVILTAMQHYGMILADNGSNFYFQGDMDPAWTESDIEELKSIPSSEFEVVGPVGPLEP